MAMWNLRGSQIGAVLTPFKHHLLAKSPRVRGRLQLIIIHDHGPLRLPTSHLYNILIHRTFTFDLFS